jgi:hypothetical protein
VNPDDLAHEVPLSVAEARGVATQIRHAHRADRVYWPWVIEKLCVRLEAAEALLRRLTGAYYDVESTEQFTEDAIDIAICANELISEAEHPTDPPSAA